MHLCADSTGERALKNPEKCDQQGGLRKHAQGSSREPPRRGVRQAI